MKPNEIRGRLIISGTSANRLAKDIGVSRQAMYQAINGETASLPIRTAISQKIGYPVSEIWPEEESSKPEAREADHRCHEDHTQQEIYHD